MKVPSSATKKMHRCASIIALFLACASVHVEATTQSRECAVISWVDPIVWESSYKIVTTWSTPECSKLSGQSEYFACSLIVPMINCDAKNPCPDGDECSNGVYPPSCVTCPSEPPFKTEVQIYPVIVNVTQAMLDGIFWTYNDFLNDTYVDLILTMYRWLWSPNLEALEQDFVQQHRSTWGDGYNYDLFRSYSRVYQVYNSTHIERREVALSRDSADTGEIQTESTSFTIYLPKLA